jgi:hypothetical protein
MDLLGQAEQQILLAEREGPTVSLYMPILAHGGAELQAEPLSLKQLLVQAEAQLLARGLRPRQVVELLEPTTRLVEGNLQFWQYQSDGLALFLAGNACLPYRLPLPFEERVVVGSRFYIRPLLPLLGKERLFYLLALSQNQVHLWRGERYTMSEVAVGKIPHSLAEATQYDQVEPMREVHSIASSGLGGGRRAVGFHGQGTAADEKLVKGSIQQFLLQVESGVTRLLADQQVPLVLAGVNYLCAMYRSLNHYRHLRVESIAGNPDRTNAEALHEQAWSIVAQSFQQERADALARYVQLAGQGSPRAVHHIPAMVNAASVGRVETLFIAASAQVWGSFDPASGELMVHNEAEPAAEELLNLAALYTLQNGGMVYPEEPSANLDGAPATALLRY